jgi:signal transduction histidine kinase
MPAIEADSNQVRQLFQNLIGNSLKFHGEEKPFIKIYSETLSGGSDRAVSGKTYRIFVEDNGIGFEQKHLERIFTLFQRLHGRSAYEGNGMGLAICRRIVERHRGSITARSEPGRGATFIITLPERQPPED